jgi:hypothetical protein
MVKCLPSGTALFDCKWTILTSKKHRMFNKIIYVMQNKTNTKDKHFENKEQYSYFWLLKKIEKLIESMNWIRNTGSWKAISYFTLKQNAKMMTWKILLWYCPIIFLLDFGTVPTVWYLFCFFHFCKNNKFLNGDKVEFLT